MPGDPLRAKWIAQTFLENPICYNTVRGMLGFTGTYKGQKVSVQGSGMGIPSALVYGNELIQEYGVKQIIRVGSAGAYQADLKLNDIVLAMSASTDSNTNANTFKHASFAPTADFGLFNKAVKYAEEQKLSFRAGNVLSSDNFYTDDPEAYTQWAKYGVLCVEMETAGLYTLGAKFGVATLSVLTISDSLVSKQELSAKDRETSFSTMVAMALDLL